MGREEGIEPGMREIPQSRCLQKSNQHRNTVDKVKSCRVARIKGGIEKGPLFHRFSPRQEVETCELRRIINLIPRIDIFYRFDPEHPAIVAIIEGKAFDIIKAIGAYEKFLIS